MLIRLVRRHWLLIAGLLLFLTVWVKNAWVCDDAYINFRALDQLRAGHGPIWNPHERVQVFTSVIWYWLQAPPRLLSADVYLNALVLSLACMLGCLTVLRRLVPHDLAWFLLVILMVGARGFMDYTSSGLENPLLFLCCALLLERYLAAAGAPAGTPAAEGPLRHLLWLAGWSLLVRHDLAVLWLPPVVQAGWRHRRLWSPRQWARTLLVAAAPLIAWSVFAIFYYGSPWPNSALAKLALDLPRSILVGQGFLYLLTARHDLVLFVVITAGAVAALAEQRTRGLGLGIVAFLIYLVWIGGDFMMGRMLGSLFLVAAVVLARVLAARGNRWLGAAAVAGAVAAFALPLTPLNSPRWLFNDGYCHGVADERAFYFQATSLLVRLRTPADEFPVHEWADAGRAAANRDQRLVGSANVGFFGYLAGPDKMIVDRFAIADPFLARLPLASLPDDWRPGHIKRDTPRGYGQSLQSGANQLQDPAKRALYDDVRLATSAPLLAPGRAAAIWRLNTRRSGRSR